jgi:hypothetical protein
MSDPASDGPKTGIEQRRAPRYPLPAYGGQVSVMGAQLVNASAYGVLIEAPLPMEEGSVMPLRLVIAGSKVDVQARVAQCHAEQGEKRRVYRIGLEFVSLPSLLREQLVEILKKGVAPAEA